MIEKIPVFQDVNFQSNMATKDSRIQRKTSEQFLVFETEGIKRPHKMITAKNTIFENSFYQLFSWNFKTNVCHFKKGMVSFVKRQNCKKRNTCPTSNKIVQRRHGL